jgi:hypothetical protein
MNNANNAAPLVDRSKLDALLAAAHAAHAERDAIDSSVSPEWIAAHRKASELYREVNAERSRLWKLAPWGSWMTPHDRELARISMRL